MPTPQYRALQWRAMTYAGSRGHKMTPFRDGVSYCKVCGADVVIGISELGYGETKEHMTGPAIEIKCVGEGQGKLL